ncbi:MAG: hypothetical protein J6Z02_00940 [Lachnospiraceae bacterium]|nr:hypothetical protein [Lachnospiraceae bacterium]
MKKSLKRLLAGMLVLAFICQFIPARTVKAAEEEINVNQAYSYTLTPGAKMLKFTAPEDGVFTVDAVINSDDGRQLEMIVLDSEGHQLFENAYGRNQFERVSTTEYATKGGRYFYVKLMIPDLEGITKDITFTVNFTASKEWENELNDTADEACKLENGAVKYGVITKDEYEDFYTFKVAKTSKVVIEFGPKTISGNYENWTVEILNDDGESHQLYGGSVSAITKETVYLKKGTYFLKVKYYINSRYVPYKISYKAENFTVKQPTVSKVKISKNTLWNYYFIDTINMKGNGEVHGFTVQAAANKKLKSKLVNRDIKAKAGVVGKKKLSTTEEIYNFNIDQSKKCYVRVRGFVTDPFGKNIYGKYSKVKSSK